MLNRLLPTVLLLASLLPLAAQDEPAEAPQCLVVVALHWPDHDLTNAQVRLFRDRERRDLVAAFPSTDAGGRVIVTAAPGTYYLTAVVDLNNDGQLNAGDGLGFHGVEDPNTQQPQPLEIQAKVSALRLSISLMVGPDGKLVATGVRPPEAPAPPVVRRLTGTVTGGTGAVTVVQLVPASGRGACHAALVGEDGAFSLTFPTGRYYVFALQDVNGSEGAGPGDMCAVHGYAPEQGQAFPTVQLDEDTALPLRLEWRISETGLLQHLETQANGPQMDLETLPAIILGRVTGAAAARGLVKAAGDSRFAQETGRAALEGERFVLAIPAGVYYLNAATEPDESGKPAAGSLIGFFGVRDLRKAHGPQPISLRPGEILSLDIALVARLDEQLRPGPIE